MHDVFTRRDFLNAMFSDYYRNHRGFVLIQTANKLDDKMNPRYFPNVDLPAIERYGDDTNVYVGVAPRERAKRGKEHIHYLVALWASLGVGGPRYGEEDTFFPSHKAATKAIKKFPRAPSILVDSGRGIHLYWLLKQTTEIGDGESVEKILAEIGRYFLCQSAASLDAVLRLPDTANPECSDQESMCQIRYMNEKTRYDLADFENIQVCTAATTTIPPLKVPLSQDPVPDDTSSEAVSIVVAIEDQSPGREHSEEESVREEPLGTQPLAEGAPDEEPMDPPLSVPVAKDRFMEVEQEPAAKMSVSPGLAARLESTPEPKRSGEPELPESSVPAQEADVVEEGEKANLPYKQRPPQQLETQAPSSLKHTEKDQLTAVSLVDESVLHDLVDEISENREFEKPPAIQQEQRKEQFRAESLLDESVLDDLIDDISRN